MKQMKFSIFILVTVYYSVSLAVSQELIFPEENKAKKVVDLIEESNLTPSSKVELKSVGEEKQEVLEIDTLLDKTILDTASSKKKNTIIGKAKIKKTVNEAEKKLQKLFGNSDKAATAKEKVTKVDNDTKTLIDDSGVPQISSYAGAPLNDVLQNLAEDAGLSYFHNAKLNGENYNVQGVLQHGAPVDMMNELAFNYGVTLHRRGSTIYAMTASEVSQLPSKEWVYQLRYLRHKNLKEHLKEILQPFLKETDAVSYDGKTNTLIVVSSPLRLTRVKKFISKIDKPKSQVVVEIKIFRVNHKRVKNVGVNWASVLGPDANAEALRIGLNNAASINNLIGLPSLPGSADLVLSPGQISGVLSALEQNEMISIVNSPTLITEDNEPANVSIIDRVPIITTEFTSTTSGTNISTNVRYKIDEEDSVSPESTREIGTTVFLTPSVLPDNTIRLKMRPRSAQITSYVESNGNKYPQVNEATLDTLARVPSGHSLIVGGFYQVGDRAETDKIPLLGDLPLVKFFFKNKQNIKEKSSLLFVVTPTAFNPNNVKSYKKAQRNLYNNHLEQRAETPPIKTTRKERSFWKRFRKNSNPQNSYKESVQNSYREPVITYKPQRVEQYKVSNSTKTQVEPYRKSLVPNTTKKESIFRKMLNSRKKQ